MKKVFITMLGIMLSAVGYCQSDFEIAQEFMSWKGVKLSEKAGTRVCEDYTIFTGVDGKGFAIVSDGVVIAYDTENVATTCILRATTRTERTTTPIKYMVKTKWGQRKPFCLECPFVDGQQAYAGCGPVALGQIMYYYKNPKCVALPDYYVPEGYVGLGPLPETTFDWDLILADYNNLYTKEQGDEVAKLMEYIGCATQTWYKETGGSYLRVEYLPRLGFSALSYEVRGSMTDEQLYDALDKELEQGRPILLAGYNESVTSGHWYVIDGRDDTGRYHINPGFDGEGNGYYMLSPETWCDGVTGPLLCSMWLNIPIMPEWWIIDDITHVKQDVTDYRTYNLQGQVIKKPSKGIYIKNKKKYIVK